MASLDDMLADDSGGEMPLPLEEDAEAVDVDEPDPFLLHAETFLDDSLSIEERAEALRAAILAAGMPPAEEEV